jgi:hypothetical protein
MLDITSSLSTADISATSASDLPSAYPLPLAKLSPSGAPGGGRFDDYAPLRAKQRFPISEPGS